MGDFGDFEGRPESCGDDDEDDGDEDDNAAEGDTLLCEFCGLLMELMLRLMPLLEEEEEEGEVLGLGCLSWLWLETALALMLRSLETSSDSISSSDSFLGVRDWGERPGEGGGREASGWKEGDETCEDNLGREEGDGERVVGCVATSTFFVTATSAGINVNVEAVVVVVVVVFGMGLGLPWINSWTRVALVRKKASMTSKAWTPIGESSGILNGRSNSLAFLMFCSFCIQQEQQQKEKKACQRQQNVG